MTNSGKLDGATILANLLTRSEVTTIFCITGAGNLAIVNALAKHTDIEIIFSHHEQAAVMEAQGYSRVTGKPGVVLVTTGGGVANSLTGVLSANLDSVPIFLISGNESSFHCHNMKEFRAYGVQGFDAVSVLQPVTKKSKRLESIEDLETSFISLWEEMTSLRKGPVHLDFPMDLQRHSITYNRIATPLKFIQKKISYTNLLMQEILEAMSVSTRPFFYLGNGLRDSKVLDDLMEFLHSHNLPFGLSWSSIDFIASDDPLCIGRIGIYGDRHSNLLLQQCDLFISLGSRLAIPQVGYDKKDFARHAKKYVVDIDPIELTKFVNLDWGLINADLEVFIPNLIAGVDGGSGIPDTSMWLSTIDTIKEAFPLREQIGEIPLPDSGYVHSFDVISELSKQLPENAIVVTDVGAALLTGHYGFRIKEGQRFFTSQGLGEMGFGLPGAIGAHFADRSRPIICLNTDGAIMFNLQELELVRHHKIPLKLFIFNNMGYAMIKISQSNLFDSNFVGSDINSGISFPEFSDIASTFGLNYKIIENAYEIGSIVHDVIKDLGSILIDVRMDPDQKYFPRLATSKLSDGTLVSPPLEDLDPKISIQLLTQFLNSQPNQASINLRK